MAFNNEEGRLVVAIIVVDLHHGGVHGYLFADDPDDLLPVPYTCIDVQGNTVFNKLDDQWRIFRYD